MDITPQDDTRQPISDDQELAKALAGVMPDAIEPVVIPSTTPEGVMDFEETPTTSLPPIVVPTIDDTVLPQPSAAPVAADEPAATPVVAANGDLEGIKKDALELLRPLIGKVDLPAEEKFDTYLMLIRSTDDSSLIAPAHIAAQAITDEKRRAEALLDIIKEIDYLSRNKTTT